MKVSEGSKLTFTYDEFGAGFFALKSYHICSHCLFIIIIIMVSEGSEGSEGYLKS